MLEQVLSPSDFIALTNQVLENAFPEITLEGEISGFSVNQSKFVFFDIKDAAASVSCFMMVYQLKVPLEDGMQVRIVARPKLTGKGRFSLTIRSVVPVGEGDLKRAFELLRAKLDKAGLFAVERKRTLPRFPKLIGLISSATAAGATDFLALIKERWGGVEVKFAAVQVQGEVASQQITSAIDYFNQMPKPVDVLVLVRGGGSLEDLMPYNTEPVVRAVAASRSPTIVGVGHEEDVSLADLAADIRAATPSHAAQLAVPDKQELQSQLNYSRSRLAQHIQELIVGRRQRYISQLQEGMDRRLSAFEYNLQSFRRALAAYDPQAALRRGYSVLSHSDKVLSSVKGVKTGDTIKARLSDGQLNAEVNHVQPKN